MAQRPLHQHGVHPTTVLEPYRLEDPHPAKVHSLVQAQRGDVFAVADHRDHLPPATRFAPFDQLAQQRMADTQPAHASTYIHRIFDSEAVGRTRSIRRDVAIAHHLSRMLGDQIRQAFGEHLRATLQQLGKARGLQFETGNTVQHMVGVNRLDGRHVVVAGVTQHKFRDHHRALGQFWVEDGNHAARYDIKKAMIFHRQHKKYFAMRRLNLNHLHTFSLVIAHGSFSVAAEHLHLTQPAVSLQVRQLEDQLNLQLIERVGKRLKPTSAGKALLEHIVRIEAVVEEALLDLSSHASGVAGQVSIGTGATACIHLLPPVLRALRLRFPDLDVRVSTGNTDGILKAVEENRLDLALVTLPAAGRSLDISPLLDDEFVAIFATSQSLPDTGMTPQNLDPLPLVVFEAGSSTRLLINEWFLQSGIRVKPVMELGSIEAIKEMVAAGLGYSIVPRMAVAAVHHRRGLQVHSLTPGLSRTLGIVVRQDKPLSKPLRQVLDALQRLKGS
ncbi:LysR family transcriptional regulator [Pseudomonas coronafaciens pv. atropurpurea]|nr:LysR family transcriptional regulator [Pseudomonas coronafaciens pv. atropurpurea]